MILSLLSHFLNSYLTNPSLILDSKTSTNSNPPSIIIFPNNQSYKGSVSLDSPLDNAPLPNDLTYTTQLHYL